MDVYNLEIQLDTDYQLSVKIQTTEYVRYIH